MLPKKFFASVSLFFCLGILPNIVYGAKSVYVISSQDAGRVQAYAIDANQVTLQAELTLPYGGTGGPIALAAWPQKDLLFATYDGSSADGSSVITWSSTKTLAYLGEYTQSGVGSYGFSGIEVDAGKGMVYVAERQTYNLYVYKWDDVNQTIEPNGTQPLSSIEHLYDIALDANAGRLYVSDGTAKIRYYNTNNWSFAGDFNIPNNRAAVAIATDPCRGYLYSGAWPEPGTGNSYLVRTLLASPHSAIENNLGEMVIGLDVDKASGLVYCTTTNKDFRVYDCNLALQDVEPNIGSSDTGPGPAGVVVGGLYKSSVFMLVKDNSDPNNNCVQPWNEIDENYLVFDLNWDANGRSDTNVVVIDQLPKEIDYDSSIPAGDYNGVDKTVKWNIGNISGASSGDITLKTKVNEWARPGGLITNVAVIEGDTYIGMADCNIPVCSWYGEIIYVDKDAQGFNNGTNWDDAYTDLRDAFTGAESGGSLVTAIWVAAGTYKPTYDINEAGYQNKSFELLEDVGLFGHFGGIGTYETSTMQRNFADANNETILDGQIGQPQTGAVQYIVKAQGIDDAVIDGFTIKNSYKYDGGAGVYLDDSNVSIANCKLRNNYHYGIYAQNYSCPDIHNCTFIDNSRGLQVDSNGDDLTPFIVPLHIRVSSVN